MMGFFVLGTVYYVYLLLQGGMTALMYASEREHIDCVKALLQRDANVNYQDEVISPKAVRYLLLICVLMVWVTRESGEQNIVCIGVLECDLEPGV